MVNPYYAIWADAISSMKKHHPNDRDWKIKLLAYMSWMHALNSWIIFIWLKFFGIFRIGLIELHVFPGTLLNDFFAFALQFALPFLILNYFLIFYKNRYNIILRNRKTSNTKFAPIYSFSVTLIAFATAVAYGLLT